MTTDFKDTIFLPRTDFPMRAGLAVKEPLLLERWRKLDLYKTQRKMSAGREKFVLHDGPPYANGHLHMGHALNKILKDVVCRSQQMLGKDANYVPGWDCHGLPIEWKVEEQYRKAGRNKDDVPILEFRQECREFARNWVEIQSAEFQRLGVIGDWERPYTTMTNAAEALIAKEISAFAMNGGLYRGARPVLWSVVEQTALADAEVEYHDHTSQTIHVRFPIVSGGTGLLDGAAVVIWTTTPWTIPGNRAIAFDAKGDYRVFEVKSVDDGGLARVGDRLVVAGPLAGDVQKRAGISGWRDLGAVESLDGVVCAHPLRGQGYDFDVPLLAGDFVTMEQGSGFVHIAPGHGEDDYRLGQANGIAIPATVGPDGRFYDEVALFGGKTVLTLEGKSGDANDAVIDALRAVGNLLGRAKLTHSYPHSWRSKAPLIFRNTAQWFISMDTNGLRDKALSAIDATRFVPQAGATRLRSMIETRPDWCVSRQRAWGVPITVFVNRKTGEVLRDQAVVDRIVEAFMEEGGDAWFASPPERFLGNDYAADDYEQVKDIIEVWFESGSTHAFVLEQRDDLMWPASLYLEGSDQHRGWFHSSLLESCGTRGRAPYDAVLTHGFVLDENGHKMSKSAGNVTAPAEVIEKSGADILRLWVVCSDYSEDIRIGQQILKHQSDLYRRMRNTLRFLLGNLAGFDDSERVAVAEMAELDRWVLHRLWELDKQVREAVDGFDFHDMWTALHNFCAVDLSAFYFDIRKDSLYCDAIDNPARRACRTVLDQLFDCLTAWLAPILCFTAEEAWLARTGDGDDNSVHLRTFPDIPDDWRDDGLAKKWAALRQVRRVFTGALEVERAEKRIGSSLQADLVWSAPDELRHLFDGLSVEEIAITSGATFADDGVGDGGFNLDDVDGVAVRIDHAPGTKCSRCYQVLEEVGQQSHDELCQRCDQVVAGLQ